MVKSVVSIFTLCIMVAWPVHARPTPDPGGNYARIYGDAAPPIGYVQFCAKRPKACKPTGSRLKRIAATPERFAELDAVNRDVNREIEPVEDIVQYGREEFWTIPTTGKGDCEEYVLVKRQRLLARQWPSSALLITVVLDENRQGHAVLTARMSNGDVILDNKHDQIKIWSETPYVYLMRQSYLNPRVWMAMMPPSTDGTPMTAGN